MFLKKIKFIVIIFLLYQTQLYSKSNNFENFNSKNLSKYFSGIVAFENKNNSEALNFFKSSKMLIDQHDPYLKRLVISLVLEGKVTEAINTIKTSGKRDNLDFFEVYILLAVDNFKKNNVNKAIKYVKMGKIKDAEKILRPAVKYLIKIRCKKIILGCTELPIAIFAYKSFKKIKESKIFIDPNLLLAEMSMKKYNKK